MIRKIDFFFKVDGALCMCRNMTPLVNNLYIPWEEDLGFADTTRVRSGKIQSNYKQVGGTEYTDFNEVSICINIMYSPYQLLRLGFKLNQRFPHIHKVIYSRH